MKRATFFTWLAVCMILLGTPASVRATVVATCFGPETKRLCELFSQAKHKVDIRCAFVDDATILKALRQTAKRGVKVRLVVDTLTPSLMGIAAQSQGNLCVHVLPVSAPARYLAEHVTRINLSYARTEAITMTPRGKRFLADAKPEGYANVDYIQSWYGEPRWSPACWVGICTTIIHTRNPDPKAGSLKFVQAWQQSTLIISDVLTAQNTSSSQGKRRPL